MDYGKGFSGKRRKNIKRTPPKPQCRLRVGVEIKRTSSPQERQEATIPTIRGKEKKASRGGE